MNQSGFKIRPWQLLLAHPPGGAPQAVWVRVRWLRGVILLSWLGVALAFAWGLAGYNQHPVWRVSFLAVLSLPFISQALFRREFRRLAEDVRADCHERCLECGYSLRGLPSDHRCPECGAAYRLDHVRWTWARFLDEGLPAGFSPEPPRVCAGCGHDLTDVDSVACPECGCARGFDKTFEQLGVSAEELARFRDEREKRRR